jgi:hypothetical protein
MPAKKKSDPEPETPQEEAPAVDPNNPSQFIPFNIGGPSQDDLNPAYAPPKDDGDSGDSGDGE